MERAKGNMTPEQLFTALTPSPHDRKPLYLQVGDRLRDIIARGALKRGDAMPPERELADRIGVSRVTIRKAFEELVGAGILSQKPGAGTFVSGRIEQPFSILQSFSEDMRARGYEPGSIWLDNEDITQQPMYQRARMGLGYLAQEASIFRGMTVEQNVKAVVELRETTAAGVRDETTRLLEELRIDHLRHAPATGLSGGERRRDLAGQPDGAECHRLRQPRLPTQPQL